MSFCFESHVYVFGGIENKKNELTIGQLIKADFSKILHLKMESNQQKNPRITLQSKQSQQSISSKLFNPVFNFPLNREMKIVPNCLISSSFSSHNSQPNQIFTLPIEKLSKESSKLNNLDYQNMLKVQYQLDNDIDSLCKKFLSKFLKPTDWAEHVSNKFMVETQEMISLINQFQLLIEKQPILLKLRRPVKIFGDIFGNYKDLMRFFDLWRGPLDPSFGGDIDSYDYLFLGNYVDKGKRSLEILCLLMALKIKYPEQIHLLRGNHEDRNINFHEGFAEECLERIEEDLNDTKSVFQTINNMFEWLPLAAIIDDKILCIHGGIGSTIKSLDDILKLHRPIKVSSTPNSIEEQKVIDILWSCTSDNDCEKGIQPSEQWNTSKYPIYKFGSDKIEEFLNSNDLDLIIRSNECVLDGFERFANGQLITLFSSSECYSSSKNAAAILVVQKDLDIVPKSIYPLSQAQFILQIEQPNGPINKKK